MEWITKDTRDFLKRWYLSEWQEPEDRILEITQYINSITKGTELNWVWEKFYEYMSKWYYSLSSPIWSNFWLDRGLPISCFGSFLEDDMENILFSNSEVWMMSKYWWGTSWYFWELRHRWAVIKNNWLSSWAVHFMQLFDKTVDIISQWAVRRGSFASYLPIDHKDILEFLDIWWEWNAIQRITTWVCVSDDWLQKMKQWDIDKRKIWAKVIQSRVEKWYPYIFFSDNVNNNTVPEYKDKTIYASNLCTEILLPSNKDWSFVCNLSSMNIEYYDEWKNTDAVKVLTIFLDIVLSDFIKKTDWDTFLKRANTFAKENRALWIWALWYHTYLQKNNIPFMSKEASNINIEIFNNIQTNAYSASEELWAILWYPKMSKVRRNTTLTAVAPTTSSAFILWQTSQSIEPIWSNCYVKDLAKMKVTVKNKILQKLLKEKWKDTVDTWRSIRENDWSVQHLDFLSKSEKDVFLTFSEINQYDIINQASDRQKFIDQWQSLNLMISPDTPTKEINKLYLYAWEKGLKTLYYQHSKSASQELVRKIKCVGCEA